MMHFGDSHAIAEHWAQDRMSHIGDPGGLLPAQANVRTRDATPEERLLAAVLDDAADCLWRKGALSKGSNPGAEQRDQIEARSWFEHPDTGYISLRFICEALELDLAKIQRYVREHAPEPVVTNSNGEKSNEGYNQGPASAGRRAGAGDQSAERVGLQAD